jgi:hypothetical protein
VFGINIPRLGKIFEQNKESTYELRIHERLILLLIAIIDVIETLFSDADYEDTFKKVIYNQKARNKLFSLLIKEENYHKTAA